MKKVLMLIPLVLGLAFATTGVPGLPGKARFVPYSIALGTAVQYEILDNLAMDAWGKRCAAKVVWRFDKPISPDVAKRIVQYYAWKYGEIVVPKTNRYGIRIVTSKEIASINGYVLRFCGR